MKAMHEIVSILIVGALLLFAIHTLSKQESDDNDAIETRIEINADVVNIEKGFIDFDLDDIESNNN